MSDTRWKPGQSGNPNGRPPKGQSLTEILKEKVNPEDVAEKLIQLAIEKEDMTALKYIYDRIDGRPKESVDLNQKGEMVYTVVPPKEIEECE
jgi:hypothetical protein